MITAPLYSAEGRNKAGLRAISVEEAVSTALGNNHEYKIAKRKLKQAGERVNRVWGTLLPAISSEASAWRQDAETGFMSLSEGQYGLKIVQLQFAVNPGFFYNTLKGAREGCEIARRELRRIKSAIEYRTIKSYFDVILAGEMVSLRKNSIKVLEENLDNVKNLYNTGSVPEFELLQAEAELESRKPLLREAQARHDIALDLFNFQLGYDTIKYRPDKSIISRQRELVPENSDIIKRLEDLAMKNRPEILQLTSRKSIARHAADAQEALYIWPVFSIGGYYGKTYMLPRELDLGLNAGTPVEADLSQITGKREWQDTWRVGAAATYRWDMLLPVNSERAKEREKEEKIFEIKEKINEVKRLTAISIRSVFAKLKTACDTIESRKKNIETAEEGLRVARESYNAGVIKNSDLLKAELLVSRAKTGYIKAVNDYYVYGAELKREVGTDVEDMIFKGVDNGK